MLLFTYDEKRHRRTLREEGREEGRAEGRADGEELMGKLFMTLKESNKLEQYERAILDKEYREKLYEEYGITKDVIHS